MREKMLVKEVNPRGDLRPRGEHHRGVPMRHEARDVAASLLHLQRSQGNRFVDSLVHGRLQQGELAVSQPDDPLEVEADRVAEAVMNMPAPMTETAPSANDVHQREQSATGTERASLPTRQSAATDPECGRMYQSPVAVPGDTALSLPPAVEQGIEGAQDGGEPLPASERQFFEPRIGVDLRSVRIHANEDAAYSAHELGARAYTIGRHIVFGSGEYQPGTHAGRRLMAHELTHVVQQAVAPSVIQRLIRTPYPWRGVITPTIGANIRSSPDSSDPANIVDSLPRGEAVKVVSASGDWLKVESHFRGPLLEGYVYHPLVDDAASSSMAASVGATMVWRPSGPGSATDFESWASAATETPLPAVSPTTKMNCWEAVLLSAYRAGAISWKWIHDLYVLAPMGDWVGRMSKGPRHVYAIPGPNPRLPQRGDLVFFDGLAHVALATGNASEVYTFWPPPNTPFAFGGTTDKVKVFSIESLVSWWTANMPPAPVVEFAAPAW